jgi:hypothetical protein
MRWHNRRRVKDYGLRIKKGGGAEAESKDE